MTICCPNEDSTCQAHGGKWVPGRGCRTAVVLQSVRDERARQFARYGSNNDLEVGTGPNLHWLRPLVREPAFAVEAAFREEYEAWEADHDGKPTWMHLIREEVAEAFKEAPGPRLREELIQVAALCVSLIETLEEASEEELAVEWRIEHATLVETWTPRA